MKVFICFGIFFIISIDASPQCPQGASLSYYDNKICYLFSNESKSFADAEKFCNGYSGNLAVVPNQFINSFLWCKFT